MSWKDAKNDADTIFDRLRESHPLTYIEMVLRALQRRLSSEQRAERRKQREDEEKETPK